MGETASNVMRVRVSMKVTAGRSRRDEIPGAIPRIRARPASEIVGERKRADPADEAVGAAACTGAARSACTAVFRQIARHVEPAVPPLSEAKACSPGTKSAGLRRGCRRIGPIDAAVRQTALRLCYCPASDFFIARSEQRGCPPTLAIAPATRPFSRNRRRVTQKTSIYASFRDYNASCKVHRRYRQRTSP